jgi:hypothetical protein
MRLRWLLVMSMMLLASSARAQSAHPAAPSAAPAPSAPAPSAAPVPDAPTLSYRWQIAASDAAALTIAMVGHGPGVPIAGAVYLLDGMFIHAVHGRVGRAAASVVVRAALPALGTIAGYWLWQRSQDPQCRDHDDTIDDSCYDGEISPGVFVGFGVGIAAAVIIDSALIARSVTVRKPKPTAWTPRLTVTPDRVALGFATRF